jgi:hypothetical protein
MPSLRKGGSFSAIADLNVVVCVAVPWQLLVLVV